MESTTRKNSKHGKHSSYTRASLTRQVTKGPLDDDPVPPHEPQSSTAVSPDAAGIPIPPSPFPDRSISPSASVRIAEDPPKDFSFLLRPEIYHPLTQLDVPISFRKSSNQPSVSASLPTLLSLGHFRAAAIAAAHQLTNSVLAIDYSQIFDLLYIRLSCLTLINATSLAAQEVKALEDISSPFYRHSTTQEHLMPWGLRLLAIRLQGIGYGDWRKCLMGYYELAREARLEFARVKKEERIFWKDKLEDLGIRVANTLVEMGDLEGAARHLTNLKITTEDPAKNEASRSRLVLMYLQIGDLKSAERYVTEDAAEPGDILKSSLKPLLHAAQGNYETAAEEWYQLREESKSDSELIVQNLAARPLLESLINAGYSFNALTFNLSTIYELCSEKSRARKIELTEQVAAQDVSDRGWEKTNLAFKI
ncbi:hypothetical protein MMC20_007921 [Loxospora ochrophaea]|nr:hypothetical protein [Loxospora ochrophaea]